MRRQSHLWRGFIEHWLLKEEKTPLWEAREAAVSERLMEEGPRLARRDEEGPRYFVVRYESLVKDPKEVALAIIDWSKQVLVLNRSEKTQARILERAEVRFPLGLSRCFWGWRADCSWGNFPLGHLSPAHSARLPRAQALCELRQCPWAHGALPPRAAVRPRSAL